MESEILCDSYRKKSYSLNHFLNKMVCDKCYFELINTFQTPMTRL